MIECRAYGCRNVPAPGKTFCFPHAKPSSRPFPVCQACGTDLREPAELCGFCAVELTSEAA